MMKALAGTAFFGFVFTILILYLNDNTNIFTAKTYNLITQPAELISPIADTDLVKPSMTNYNLKENHDTTNNISVTGIYHDNNNSTILGEATSSSDITTTPTSSQTSQSTYTIVSVEILPPDTY